MLERIKESEFIVFDCETTGLNFRMGNQIIELAAQKVRNNEVVAEWHELINPTVPVEDGSYQVHKLSNLFLSENGGKAEELLAQFREFIGESILVGHNILTFDVPFLNVEFTRVGLTSTKNLLVDTLLMARKLLPGLPNHKLVTVASHFDIDPSGAHRAMVDVEMNRQVFMRMLNQYLDQLAQEEKKRQTSAKSGRLL